jgi:predicted restriction endonuclease
MLRPCITCGVLVENASYCASHDPNSVRRRVTPGRTTKAQGKFRRAVLANAGHRCQAIEHGKRCEVTAGLQAHHLDRLADSRSYDPRKGVALCPRHHAVAERIRARTHAA